MTAVVGNGPHAARLVVGTLMTLGAVLAAVPTWAQTGGVQGRVTNATNGAPIANVRVEVSSTGGTLVSAGLSDATGTYTALGLSPGQYVARTRVTHPGLPDAPQFPPGPGHYIDEVYDNLPCGSSCPVTSGTPITVTTGAITPAIDFALMPGGIISGSITDAATAAPLTGVGVTLFSAAGTVVGGAGPTGTSGAYSIDGLPAGAYYLRTTFGFAAGYVDELYDNVPCPYGCTATSGTPVAVSLATTTTIDFALATGGQISGRVTAEGGSVLAGVRIDVYTPAGAFVRHALTAADGTYAVIALPTGSYRASSGAAGYTSEVYDNLPCAFSCVVTTGAPIAVTTGLTTGGIDFALAPAGAIGGTVTDATNSAPVPGVFVSFLNASGNYVGGAATNNAGTYLATGLPGGTLFARTSGPAGYIDEIFDDIPRCFPSCLETTGTPITVSSGATTEGIDFALTPATELIRNGDFSDGINYWSRYATPDMSYQHWSVDGGVLAFDRKAPPAGTSNQSVVFQETSTALPAGTNLEARFFLGNSSTERRRISVVVHDSDFSDLSVCTFWLPPLSAPYPYGLRMRTTEAWSNATLSVYAASVTVAVGSYRVDNVSLHSVPAPLTEQTSCVDRAAYAPPGPATPELLVNGDFASGTDGWDVYGQITSQVSGGVLEFVKDAGTPAGVIFQKTGQALPTGAILAASFELGNSSPVRKRVTALLHDTDFSDLSACTFWLEPGQPLSTYTYRAFTTKAWTNTTLSVYPATGGADQWIRLDNVTLRREVDTWISGAECVEPTGGSDAGRDEGASPIALETMTGPGLGSGGGTPGPRGVGSPVATTGLDPLLDHWVVDGFAPVGDWRAGPSWIATADGPRAHTLQLLEPIDMVHARYAALYFTSTLRASASTAVVQASVEGGDWDTVSTVAPTDTPGPVTVDLSGYAGRTIRLRFVFDVGAGAPGTTPDEWRIDDIGLDLVIDAPD